MRYRQLSPSGDMTFGSGQLNFLINTPEAVAQAVMTSLLLWLGEWYLDITDGTPYPEGVLGRHSQAQADAVIIARIQQVQGVVDIVNFKSVVDPLTRAYTVIGGTLNTIYGVTQLEMVEDANF